MRLEAWHRSPCPLQLRPSLSPSDSLLCIQNSCSPCQVERESAAVGIKQERTPFLCAFFLADCLFLFCGCFVVIPAGFFVGIAFFFFLPRPVLGKVKVGRVFGGSGCSRWERRDSVLGFVFVCGPGGRFYCDGDDRGHYGKVGKRVLRWRGCGREGRTGLDELMKSSFPGQRGSKNGVDGCVNASRAILFKCLCLRPTAAICHSR